MTDKECISGLEVLKQIPHAKNFVEHIDMAIKAVEQQQNIHDTCKKCIEFSEFEQQPCEDCISRAEAVRIAESYYHTEQVVEEIRELSSVTPQQTRWIPCIERLPEDYDHVLVQFCMGGMSECYLAHDMFHIVGGLRISCDEVIAWMPLPHPYNAESEDKK